MINGEGRDTIFALSTGHPPAAIAIIRISGPNADYTLEALTGALPEPRQATLATFADPATGELLDRGLVLRFKSPASATGEDIAELHLHGGRSVVDGVLRALGALPGLRMAAPGEFTRRAFGNGRIDLLEAEGLADLLAAETESQRRAALVLAGGRLSGRVQGWQIRLLDLGARVEASLGHPDEDNVASTLPQVWFDEVDALAAEISAALRAPSSERLRDGIKVVIAGPPNVGKSTLLNCLAGREAAITSSIAGTTRDLIEAPTAIDGVPFLLVDTAGLRDSDEEVERIGISRAEQSLEAADVILWLGDPASCPAPERAITVAPKADLGGSHRSDVDINVSALTGRGIDDLTDLLRDRSRLLLPGETDIAINDRQRRSLAAVRQALAEAQVEVDLLIQAESLRSALRNLDQLTGKAGVEQMLDALFARFCLGK